MQNFPKRLFFAALIALVCAIAPQARAQVTVTGNLKDVGVSNISGSNTFMRFSLTNYGSSLPRVTGTNVIAIPYKDFHPDSNGNISGTIQGNDTITPGGTLYNICAFYQGQQFRCAEYSITGASFNLDSATPVVTPPSAATNILGAKTYEYTQSSAATTWVIPHNFGDKNVVFNCYDGSGNFLIPNTVTETDINTLTVTFFTPQAGSCTVMNAGNVAYTNAAANSLVTNPTATQTISGEPLVLSPSVNFTVEGSTTFSGPVSFADGFSLALPVTITSGSTNNTLAATVTAARTWTLQDASDTFVFRNTSDTLTNKTFDVTQNIFKTAANTAGHVLRNNGTQYVDAQLAAGDLSNGTSGSGAVCLVSGCGLTSPTISNPTIASPVINSAASGAGVQGTDAKLLTAGTISGVGNPLCSDVNGGASSTCTTTQSVQTFCNTFLTSDKGIATTAMLLATCSVTMPTGGCPCRVLLSRSLYLTYASSEAWTEFWVFDGTNTNAFARTATSNGSSGGKTEDVYSGMTTSTYANNAVVTFSLYGQDSAGTATVNAAPSGAPSANGSSVNSSFQASVFTSN